MYSILGAFTRAKQEQYEKTKYGQLLSVHTCGINEYSEDEPIKRSADWYDNMMVYVMDGSAIIEINDKNFSIKPGDIAVLPRRTPYKIFSTPYCRWYWVHFSSSIPLSDFHVPECKSLSVGKSLILENELNSLIEECNNIDYNTQEICTCQFLGILFRIGRMCNRREKDIRFEDAVDYAIKAMTVNEASSGYVKQYAAMAGCNEIKFRDECKKRTGLTPKQYIISKKVQRIKRDLVCFNGSLQEYSRSLGFEQYSYFCKFVKKHLGMSPENYIKAVGSEKFKSGKGTDDNEKSFIRNT